MDELQELADGIQEARNTVLHCITRVNEQQALFKNSPEEWSILEVVEHLTLAEEGILKLVAGTIARLKTGKSLYSGEHVHKGVPLRTILSQRTGKAKAPEPVQPSAKIPWPELLERYRAIDQRIPENFRLFQEVDLRSLLYPHAFLGVLDMYQWLELMREHALRHQKQIKAIQQSPGYAKAG